MTEDRRITSNTLLHYVAKYNSNVKVLITVHHRIM